MSAEDIRKILNLMESVSEIKPAVPATLEEAWKTKVKTPKAKLGMFKGKTVVELRKKLATLKKSGPHKRGSDEYTMMRELEFAIRAKTGWGKVKESTIVESNPWFSLFGDLAGLAGIAGWGFSLLSRYIGHGYGNDDDQTNESMSFFESDTRTVNDFVDYLISTYEKQNKVVLNSEERRKMATLATTIYNCGMANKNREDTVIAAVKAVDPTASEQEIKAVSQETLEETTQLNEIFGIDDLLILFGIICVVVAAGGMYFYRQYLNNKHDGLYEHDNNETAPVTLEAYTADSLARFDKIVAFFKRSDAITPTMRANLIKSIQAAYHANVNEENTNEILSAAFRAAAPGVSKEDIKQALTGPTNESLTLAAMAAAAGPGAVAMVSNVEIVDSIRVAIAWLASVVGITAGVAMVVKAINNFFNRK